MTALNVLIQRMGVHLYSDGTAYDNDGCVAFIGSKVTIHPNIPAVIGIRGPAIATSIFPQEIEGVSGGSFDELRSRIVGRLRECAAHYSEKLSRSDFGSEFDVVVAGWSEHAGPSAYIVSSHNHYGPAWTVVPMQGLMCLPNDETIATKIEKITDRFGRDPERFSHISDGVAIMQAQRSIPTHHPGSANPLISVGGFVQLTSITLNTPLRLYRTAEDVRISTRVIHRWSDEVGTKITAQDDPGQDAR